MPPGTPGTLRLSARIRSSRRPAVPRPAACSAIGRRASAANFHCTEKASSCSRRCKSVSGTCFVPSNPHSPTHAPGNRANHPRKASSKSSPRTNHGWTPKHGTTSLPNACAPSAIRATSAQSAGLVAQHKKRRMPCSLFRTKKVARSASGNHCRWQCASLTPFASVHAATPFSVPSSTIPSLHRQARKCGGVPGTFHATFIPSASIEAHSRCKGDSPEISSTTGLPG